MTSWPGFDTTTPEVVPGGAFVFPYYNGDYTWPRAQLARFPGARAMIDVYGDAWSACSVLQIDGTPAEIAALIAKAPEWAYNRNLFRPDTATIYTDQANLPDLRAAFEARSVPEPWIWLATLDGTVCLDSVPGGWGQLAAVQAWSAGLAGFHVDISVIVSAAWYHAHGGNP